MRETRTTEAADVPRAQAPRAPAVAYDTIPSSLHAEGVPRWRCSTTSAWHYCQLQNRRHRVHWHDTYRVYRHVRLVVNRRHLCPFERASRTHTTTAFTTRDRSVCCAVHPRVPVPQPLRLHYTRAIQRRHAPSTGDGDRRARSANSAPTPRPSPRFSRSRALSSSSPCSASTVTFFRFFFFLSAQ